MSVSEPQHAPTCDLYRIAESWEPYGVPRHCSCGAERTELHKAAKHVSRLVRQFVTLFGGTGHDERTILAALDQLDHALALGGCRECGAPDCSHLWPSQRKCCPDCTHASGPSTLDG